MMRSKVIKVCEWGFVILTFALLLYRITLHADVDDEIMNLSIAYRITMGDIPFYHIQESYQMGALFLAPFLWIFVKLTGGTTGIVLYSRVVYIAVLVICMILTYQLLKKYINKELAFFISYVIVFFRLFSMFYLWYDTEAVIFFLLGDLAIIKALEQSRNIKQKYLFFVLAGIAHSCMAVAHVSTIPVALAIAFIILFLVYRNYGKKWGLAIKSISAYALFPVVVVFFAVVFLLVSNNFKLAIEFVTQLVGGRLQVQINFIDIMIKVKDTFMVSNPYLVQITKLLLVIFMLSWFIPKIYPVLAIGVIILPAFNQMVLPDTSVKGLPNYIAYLALWAPLFYCMIKKKDNIDRCLMYLFVLPIFVSAIFIPFFSMTSSYGPIKAWQMFLTGMVATLYYIQKLWNERVGKAANSCIVLYMITSISLLYNAYSFYYLCYPAIQMDDTRITNGIYAGIKVNESMACMEELQQMVETYTNGCETLLASKDIRCIYLMTDLKPFVGTTESPTFFDGDIQRWKRTIEYFNKFDDLPDIMFLEDYDLQDIYFEDMLNTNYKLMQIVSCGEHEIYIYKGL